MTDELNPEDFIEGELRDCAESLNRVKLNIELSIKDDRALFDPVTGKFLGAPDGFKPFIMDKKTCEEMDKELDTLDNKFSQHYFMLDEHKNIIPASMSQWGMWFSTRYNKYMYRTYFSDKIFLSTVFLGIDHGWNLNDEPNYRPVLFETLLMGYEPDDSEFMQRYCTYQEAELGHAAAVEYLCKEYDLSVMD